MAIQIAGRAHGLGSLLALLVLICALVLWLVGGVTPLMLLGLVGALALAYLVG